jgi:hypothetical protein
VDFLKYLDVVIGLAVVMVLVSPLVTAVTQMWMWMRNRRTIFAQEMVYRLLVQVGGPRAVLLTATATPAGTPITLDPVGQTDPTGQLWLPGGIPDASVKKGVVAIVAKDSRGKPLKGCTLKGLFVPQRTIEDERVSTTPSTADGKAEASHTFDGSPSIASAMARLSVMKGDKRSTDARTVEWSVNDSRPETITIQPQQNAEIKLPDFTASPVKYDFKFTLLDQHQAKVADEQVVVELLRNTRWDLDVDGDATSKTDGVIRLTVPHASMDPELARAVTTAVVNHPLLARSRAPRLPPPLPRLPPFKNRTAEVVEREELIRVLLELAAGEGEGAVNLSATNREALRKVLTANGIPDPTRTLSNIRTVAQQLEQTEPQQAAHVRHAQAIVAAAHSDFVGKITQWFDAACSRATQQYAAEARAATVVASLFVALAIQLDSFDLLRRLSSDDALRDALVAEGKTQQERIDKLTESAATSTAAAGATTTAPATTTGTQTQQGAGGSAGSKPGQKPAATSSPEATSSTSASSSAAAKPSPQASVGNDDELALAKAKRDEIDKNLATLRAPSLAILPDHFVWQGLKRARVDRNPAWSAPYPATLSLVAGGSTHSIAVHWRRDPLEDVKTALDASGAPVTTAIESPGTDVVIRSTQPLDLRISGAGKELAVPVVSVAQAALDINYADWIEPIFAYEKSPMQLVVDDKKYPLTFSAPREQVFAVLEQQIRTANPGLSVTCYSRQGAPAPCPAQEPPPPDPSATPPAKPPSTPSAKPPAERPGSKAEADAKQPPVAARLVITALKPDVKEIRLLWNGEDPLSNVLNDTERVGRMWRVRAEELRAVTSSINVTAAHARRSAPVSVEIKPGPSEGVTAASFVAAFNQAYEKAIAPSPRLRAAEFRADQLVITSKRLGPLELRYAAGKPETNILNTEGEHAYPILGLFGGSAGAGAIFGESASVGILLSWVLLSLGAPFWYDALKNLLKLRPTAAAVEERNRNNRATEAPATTEKPKK